MSLESNILPNEQKWIGETKPLKHCIRCQRPFFPHLPTQSWCIACDYAVNEIQATEPFAPEEETLDFDTLVKRENELVPLTQDNLQEDSYIGHGENYYQVSSIQEDENKNTIVELKGLGYAKSTTLTITPEVAGMLGSQWKSLDQWHHEMKCTKKQLADLVTKGIILPSLPFLVRFKGELTQEQLESQLIHHWSRMKKAKKTSTIIHNIAKDIIYSPIRSRTYLAHLTNSDSASLGHSLIRVYEPEVKPLKFKTLNHREIEYIIYNGVKFYA